MTTRYDVTTVPLQGGYVAKQCPVRAQNDAWLEPIETVVDAFTQRLFDRGNAFESEVVAQLILIHPGTVVVEGHGEDLVPGQCARNDIGQDKCDVGRRHQNNGSGHHLLADEYRHAVRSRVRRRMERGGCIGADARRTRSAEVQIHFLGLAAP